MRKVVSIILAMSMVLSLCACGRKEEKTAASETAAETKTEAVVQEKTSEATTEPASEAEAGLPEGPVEIQMWTDFNVSEEVLQGVIDRFEAAYKDQGYTIVLDKFAGSDRATKLSLAKESRTLPALFLSAWFTSADEVHQGNILDIDDIAQTAKSDIYPSTYDATCINGKSYMIGLYQSYFGLLYNADYFKAAGLEEFIPANELEIAAWSLSDFQEKILPALAEQFRGTEKYPLGLFAASVQADTHMMNWLSMYGGQMWKDGRSNSGSDEKVIKALDTMKAWTDAGYTNTDVATKDGTEVMPDFQNQLCAISHGQYTNYVATKGKIDSGEIEKFDVRLASVPAEDNGTDRNIMASYIYGACVMNNGKEDEIAVAKEFLRWLLQDKESLTAINTAGTPCFKSIAKAVEAEYPIYASYEKMSGNLWDFTGNVPGFVETRKDLFPAIQSVYSGEKTAADALTEYSEKANKVIDEYTQNSLVLNP